MADYTEDQTGQDQRLSRELSRRDAVPPTQPPGYEVEKLIGRGAYGEVWVATDKNTGRQVAIKFYTHQGGLDWSLLNREVEKLVFLSADRYVVQLLEVGWEYDPPFYVMEYIESGSLEDLLSKERQLDRDDAVSLFREICQGLAHSHQKGVLHCDLKPANVLLDQDRRPRLADFGQSRLSHEQSPALGTLFYMAPEQADLDSLPDVRWDIFALGAIFYCMLTGSPPHKDPEVVDQIETAKDLPDKLARYRKAIQAAPVPSKHYQVPGVDKALCEIIDRCLAPAPSERYPSVEAVLQALDQREAVRARRPLLIMGLIGPALLILIAGLFAARGYQRAMVKSNEAVSRGALQLNHFAAESVSTTAEGKLNEYFRAVERVSQDPTFLELFREAAAPRELLDVIADRSDGKVIHPEERDAFLKTQGSIRLTEYLDALLKQGNNGNWGLRAIEYPMPSAASLFATDHLGTHVGSAFDEKPTSSPIGKNFAWRSYFHGGTEDLPSTAEVALDDHIQTTHMSAAFQSSATGLWKVAVSTPIYDKEKFIGVLALTFNLGDIVEFNSAGGVKQFAVLIDARPGVNQGVILEHPLFDEIRSKGGGLPPEYSQPEHFASIDLLPKEFDPSRPPVPYKDPLGDAPGGESFSHPWLAAAAEVELPEAESEVLLVVVQSDAEFVTQPIRELGRTLIREALLAVGAVTLVIGVLWFFVTRMLSEPQRRRTSAPSTIKTPAVAPNERTLSAKDT
jgi:hypothetical protein